MKLIGIVGNMGSGKTTLAHAIIEGLEEQGLLVGEFNFADELKHIAKEYFDIPIGAKDERARDVYQKLGASFRAIDEDVWIRLFFETLRQYNYDVVVCGDMRYLTEFLSFIHKPEATIFIMDVQDRFRKERIERRENRTIRTTAWKAMHKHESEQEITQIKKYLDMPNVHLVDNNEDIDDFSILYLKVKDLL